MFKRALLECNVEYLAIKLMLGHKIDDIKLANYKNKPEILKEEYLKGLKKITLEEVKIVTTERYDNVINELKIEKEERKKLENRIKNLEDEKQNSKNMKDPDVIRISNEDFEKYGHQASKYIKKP